MPVDRFLSVAPYINPISTGNSVKIFGTDFNGTMTGAVVMNDPDMKTGVDESFEVTFDGATQRIIETTFKAFPDANDRLYFIGDETAAIGGS